MDSLMLTCIAFFRVRVCCVRVWPLHSPVAAGRTHGTAAAATRPGRESLGRRHDGAGHSPAPARKPSATLHQPVGR